MKIGVRPHHLWRGLECETVLRLRFLPCVEILEVAVGQRFVGQRPQTFGGLQLRRVRRQPVQMDA